MSNGETMDSVGWHKEVTKWRTAHREAERKFANAVMRAEQAEAENARLREALRSAHSSLTWGDYEMRGRAPQHWLDALDAARAALAPAFTQPDLTDELDRYAASKAKSAQCRCRFGGGGVDTGLCPIHGSASAEGGVEG
jgi:hypothetical protein